MDLVRPFPLTFTDYTVNITETEYPAYNAGTTYAIGDTVIDDHRVYVSTVDSNLGNTPSAENQLLTSKRWLYISHTNAYRFMDGTIGNKTTNGSTTVTIDVDNVSGLEAVAFFGMRASSIRVQGFDGLSAEVYDQTISLSGRTVYTFYEWLTETLGEAQNKAIFLGFPTDVATLTITIAGAAIEIGEVVIGDVISVGTATMGPETNGDVVSYSRFEFNAYGWLDRLTGPTRTRMRYRVVVPRASFSTVKDQMDRLAGEIVVAIGSYNRLSTMQIGILGTIKWNEDLPNHYIITFQVDGVT